METLGNQIMPELCHKFYCNICDYRTSRKGNFDTHNNSNKHKNNVLTTNDNEIKQILSKNYHCQNCSKGFLCGKKIRVVSLDLSSIVSNLMLG